MTKHTDGKVEGLINEIFNDLLDIINDENLTNGFETGIEFKDGRKDIVVSLPEVNGHIVEAKSQMVSRVKGYLRGEGFHTHDGGIIDYLVGSK